ncbi:MAG: RNA polymerase sigma factor [Ruminiclostridium sp.]|nr:RNA polymerase sigma factor [Ruminiclostridium sp.]MBR1831919.1 RNA polymerase sigma factor [Ruminiclostridium sp.]
MLSFYLSMVETEEQKSFVENVYIQYEQDLYKVALSILHNKQDAEDAVHDTFIQIVKNIDKIMQIDRPKLRGFLVIISRNCSINIYRKRKKDAHFDIDDEDQPEAADDFDLEQSITNKQEQEKVREALNKMNDDQRSIILMRYFYDMSLDSISSELNISYEAVRKRLDRARSALYRVLTGGNDNEC